MHAIFVIRLKGPRHSSHNPLDSLRVQPLNTCTIEPHQRPKKKEVPNLQGCPVACSYVNGYGQSLELHRKKKLLSWLPAMQRHQVAEK